MENILVTGLGNAGIFRRRFPNLFQLVSMEMETGIMFLLLTMQLILLPEQVLKLRMWKLDLLGRKVWPT